MTDCIDCGFTNPSSVGVVVCRNCGTKLPAEPPDNKTGHSASTTEQPETGIGLDLSPTPSPLVGNRPKAWRWVGGIALSIVIVFLSWSWWVVASLSSSDSQAEQNGAGWAILVGALLVLFPAVAVL